MYTDLPHDEAVERIKARQEATRMIGEHGPEMVLGPGAIDDILPNKGNESH